MTNNLYQKLLDGFFINLGNFDMKDTIDNRYFYTWRFRSDYNKCLDEIREIVNPYKTDLPALFRVLLEFSHHYSFTYKVENGLCFPTAFTFGRAQAISEVIRRLNFLIRRDFCTKELIINEDLLMCLEYYAVSPFNYALPSSEEEIDMHQKEYGKTYPIREKNPESLYKGQVFNW